MDDIPQTQEDAGEKKSAIFMIGKDGEDYKIITGNYMFNSNVEVLRGKMDKVNSLTPEELKQYYKEVLNNGTMSEKGGGGLGMIDIARKSGQKLDYEFLPIDDVFAFFTLTIKISPQKN